MEGKKSPPTSPIAPLAPYPPIQSRSRAPEIYGFVVWTSTSIFFALYMLWGLLPDKHLIWLGIKWYPSREWAILLPAYSVVLIALTYFAYWALAIWDTPAFSDLRTIVDSKGHLPPDGDINPYLQFADPNYTPEIYDIPIGLFNRVAYYNPRQSKGNNPSDGPRNPE